MSSNEWKAVRLEELCSKITSGGTPNTQKKEYYGGNIPWLKTQEVTFNRIYKTETFITEEGLSNSSAKWIPENAVIVAMYGATAGRIAVNKIPLTTNQACCNLIVNSELANYNFIYYHLLSRFEEIAGMAIGGAQPNLNAGMIKDLKISIPSIEAQNNIAHILSTIDDKIENNLATNQTLEEIARTLFKEWFVNFNYPNADGNLKHSEFGEIPESWEVGTLGDIANQVKESIKPSSLPEKEFHHFSLPAFDSDELPSIDLGSSILSNKTAVKKYSVLFSKLNPRIPRIWSIGDIDEEISICSTEFIGFTPKQDFFYSYLNYFLKQPELVTKLTGIATGTSNSHQRIKPTDLLELEVLIPDNVTIRKFEKIVKPILETRFHKILENQQLKKTRDSLLPKLMSGEIEVNG